MRANDGNRTGGEILIDQLVCHGVQHVFCLPGESYLAALDAFYDRPINLTVCRQEGGATMMAEAVGKVTGRPGVVFCTRGPGARALSPPPAPAAPARWWCRGGRPCWPSAARCRTRGLSSRSRPGPVSPTWR